MALILLPDDCSPPNTATKKRAREPEATPVAKSDSAASLSSRGSTFSKGSGKSTGSSNCSFAPVRAAPGESGKRVRIAIGGGWESR